MSCFRRCRGAASRADAAAAAPPPARPTLSPSSLRAPPLQQQSSQTAASMLRDPAGGGASPGGGGRYLRAADIASPKPPRSPSASGGHAAPRLDAKAVAAAHGNAQHPPQNGAAASPRNAANAGMMPSAGAAAVVTMPPTPRIDSAKRSSRKDLRRNASKVSERADRGEWGTAVGHGPHAFGRSPSGKTGGGYRYGDGAADMNGGYGASGPTSVGHAAGGGGGVIIDIAVTHNTFHESTDGREATDNNGLSRGQNFAKVEKWLREASKYQLIDITPRKIENIESTDGPPAREVGEPPTELDRLPPMMPAAQSQLSIIQ